MDLRPGVILYFSHHNFRFVTAILLHLSIYFSLNCKLNRWNHNYFCWWNTCDCGKMLGQGGTLTESQWKHAMLLVLLHHFAPALLLSCQPTWLCFSLTGSVAKTEETWGEMSACIADTADCCNFPTTIRNSQSEFLQFNVRWVVADNTFRCQVSGVSKANVILRKSRSALLPSLGK